MRLFDAMSCPCFTKRRNSGKRCNSANNGRKPQKAHSKTESQPMMSCPKLGRGYNTLYLDCGSLLSTVIVTELYMLPRCVGCLGVSPLAYACLTSTSLCNTICLGVRPLHRHALCWRPCLCQCYSSFHAEQLVQTTLHPCAK